MNYSSGSQTESSLIQVVRNAFGSATYFSYLFKKSKVKSELFPINYLPYFLSFENNLIYF